jgi:hypothetical protein
MNIPQILKLALIAIKAISEILEVLAEFCDEVESDD